MENFVCRPTQNYINIKSSSPASPRTVSSATSYVQGSNAGPSSVSGVSSSVGTGSVVAVTGSIASAGIAGGTAAVAVSAVTATTGGGFVAVPVPTGLRYVHPYLPPPLPAPSAPVNQTPPPPGAAAAYTRVCIHHPLLFFFIVHLFLDPFPALSKIIT